MKLSASDMLAQPARLSRHQQVDGDRPAAAGRRRAGLQPADRRRGAAHLVAPLSDRREARPGERLPVRQRRRADRQLRCLCRGRSRLANQLLAEAIPNGYVRAEAIQGSIVLRGQVPSATDASRAVEITQSMIERSPLSVVERDLDRRPPPAHVDVVDARPSRPAPARASSTSSPSPARSRWR